MSNCLRATKPIRFLPGWYEIGQDRTLVRNCSVSWLEWERLGVFLPQSWSETKNKYRKSRFSRFPTVLVGHWCLIGRHFGEHCDDHTLEDLANM